MPTFSLLPGALNIEVKRTDELAAIFDFDIDLSSYQVSSNISSLVTGSVVTTMTTSIVNAAAGQVGIAMSEAATTNLAVGTYGWALNSVAPGSVTRTLLAGFLEVVK
jgi:hypothetical protein